MSTRQFQNDFEQILDGSYGKKALIIVSQLPVSDWYALFKNELIAEACLDRIIHNATRLQPIGESLRKKYSLRSKYLSLLTKK